MGAASSVAAFTAIALAANESVQTGKANQAANKKEIAARRKKESEDAKSQREKEAVSKSAGRAKQRNIASGGRGANVLAGDTSGVTPSGQKTLLGA